MKYELTKSQENFCETAGLFGSLLSAACLIQHFIFTAGEWVAFAMALTYVLSIVSFVLLMKKSWRALTLTIVAACMVILQILLLWWAGVFFVLPCFLFIYLGITIILMVTEETGKKLKLKFIADREDALEWERRLNQ